VHHVKEIGMEQQVPIEALVDSHDTDALAVGLASDAGKTISGRLLSIDNDRAASLRRRTAALNHGISQDGEVRRKRPGPCIPWRSK
jgi:hypothetical protein